MDNNSNNNYYIPSFKKKEFDIYYAQAAVNFVFIFIFPLIVLFMGDFTSSKMIMSFFKQYDKIVIAVGTLSFILFYINKRILFLKLMRTSYYIKDGVIIKGTLKLHGNKKKYTINELLFSSFISHKRYNSKYDDDDLTDLSASIYSNTNLDYVKENFFTNLYEREEFIDYNFYKDKYYSYLYKNSEDKKFKILKLYTNDEKFLNYEGYQHSNIYIDYARRVVLNLILIVLGIFIDIVVNYAHSVKISRVYNTLDGYLRNYGYAIDSHDYRNFHYYKGNSTVGIKFGYHGEIKDVSVSVEYDDFSDPQTVRFIMNKILECDDATANSYLYDLDECFADNCEVEKVKVECGGYDFLLKKENGRFIMYNK